ncbi:unnamed protein product, partial [Mesorhabditis spiculigera]
VRRKGYWTLFVEFPNDRYANHRERYCISRDSYQKWVMEVYYYPRIGTSWGGGWSAIYDAYAVVIALTHHLDHDQSIRRNTGPFHCHQLPEPQLSFKAHRDIL